MVRRYHSALIACGLVAAGLGGATVAPALAQASLLPRTTLTDIVSPAATAPPNSVTVSGSGEVRVPPDMATVTFGVLSDQTTAADAQDEANRVIASAVRSLRRLGIPDRRIQTATITLQPRYDNSGNVIGYEASQTLAVLVDGVALAGRVVDAGVAARANNNVSITYGLRDENAARTAALKVAVGIARTRAAAAAAALGRTLAGAHVQITENTGTAPPQPVMAAGRQAAPGAAAPTQAFGGTLTVHEDVRLTYTF